MNLETEVKFYLADMAAMQAKLQAVDAQLIKPRQHEHNLRYEDAAGSLTARAIVLRLRQDERVRLTYKAPSQTSADNPAGLSTRYERETTIGDFDTLHDILSHLGFTVSMAYEKYRTTYHWLDTEIVLDEMPYGDFMEIEGEPEAIEEVIARLGLSAAPRILRSYADLFETVKARLGLSFRDLTFANFRGIVVPSAAFQAPSEGQTD